jgi:adenosylhomocysteine nucleosidase
VLIVTPLAIEHAALGACLEAETGFSESDHHGVKVLSFHGKKVDLAVGGHGKVQFALSTQLLIQQLKPGLVICAGAAGSLHPEIQPLDVVISEVTIEHDFRVRFSDHELPRFPADTATLEKIRRRLEPTAYNVHFGPLASGDEDILDEARAREVRALTGAVAVAWEGAGGARACRLHGVPFVEIRAITDGADAHAPRAFTQNVKAGMKNIAQVIETIL